MKRLFATLLLFCSMLVMPATASADWRWAPPKIKAHTVRYKCADLKCIHKTYVKERKRLKRKIIRYNKHRLREWKHWTRLFIPACTWYGESGVGPQFAAFRYSVWNSGGSGARGKYQMMQGTYADNAKYFDWSPLDQEIAGHREFWQHGTAPWEAC